MYLVMDENGKIWKKEESLRDVWKSQETEW